MSRSHPALLKRLLELEVPEIHEGIVEIKDIAREAGHRSKVSVLSYDPNAVSYTHLKTIHETCESSLLCRR